MRALVTGATGFIGRRLVRRLGTAVVLTRDPERARATLGDVEAHRWDPEAGPPAAAALDGVEAIFNLAGKPLAEGRFTTERKAQIRASRVDLTRRLVEAAAARTERPRVLVSASATGYYGSRADEVLDETSAAGSDFLATLCRDWEAEAARAREAGIRVVNARFGVVLGPGGGALARMLTPFKLCVGGRLGSGRQWMSWAHIDDAVGLLVLAAEREDISGPLNVVAPNPVTNRDFTAALAGALGRPAIFPAPAFALRLALGEIADLLLLASQRALPRVAERAGYAFRFPAVGEGLAASLKE